MLSHIQSKKNNNIPDISLNFHEEGGENLYRLDIKNQFILKIMGLEWSDYAKLQ